MPGNRRGDRVGYRLRRGFVECNGPRQQMMLARPILFFSTKIREMRGV
jgi:hypothetical protein